MSIATVPTAGPQTDLTIRGFGPIGLDIWTLEGLNSFRYLGNLPIVKRIWGGFRLVQMRHRSVYGQADMIE
jgi:hypothetical protein